VTVGKVSAWRWLLGQLAENNKEWINGLGYNQLQSGEGLDQYL
jgi:hypothetical protein